MTSYDSTVDKPITQERKLLLLILLAIAGAVAVGLAVTQDPVIAVAGVLAIMLLLCLLKWPDTATLLVIFFIYTNIGPVLIKFQGVPVLLATIFPLILIVPLVSFLIIRREKVVITPVLQLLLALAVIYTLGAIFSSDITLAMPQLTEFLLEGFLLFFLITNVVRTPAMLKRVVWVLLISGAIIGGLSLYQQVTRTWDNNYGGFAQVQSDFTTSALDTTADVPHPRLAGSVGEKNRYGQNMLMLVPLGLFQLWIYRSTRMRILALLMTALIIVGGALSYSRGAAVGFVLLILIMVFLRYIKFQQFVLLVGGAWLILLALPQYGARLSSLNVVTGLLSPDNGPAFAGADNAVVDRASLMLASVLIFRDHPVFGVGPGMVRYYTENYVKQVGLSSVAGTFQAHDLYLGIAAEAGALGLICFLLILYIPLRDLAIVRKKWMKSRPELSYLATAFFQAIVGYMVTGLFLHLSYYRFFYLMLALGVAASRLGESEQLAEAKVTERVDSDVAVLPAAAGSVE
jgi:hypothetical protein